MEHLLFSSACSLLCPASQSNDKLPRRNKKHCSSLSFPPLPLPPPPVPRPHTNWDVARTKLLWGSPVCYVFLHFLYHLEGQLIRQCNSPTSQLRLRLREMSNSPRTQSWESGEMEFRISPCDVRFSLSLSQALSAFAHPASWVTE